jgi:hypothetical protein
MNLSWDWFSTDFEDDVLSVFIGQLSCNWLGAPVRLVANIWNHLLWSLVKRIGSVIIQMQAALLAWPNMKGMQESSVFL